MEEATDVIRVALPACERDFIFQPCRRYLTFSIISSAAAFISLLDAIGMPKYFSFLFEAFIPMKFASRDFWVREVFLLNIMTDLK